MFYAKTEGMSLLALIVMKITFFFASSQFYSCPLFAISRVIRLASLMLLQTTCSSIFDQYGVGNSLAAAEKGYELPKFASPYWVANTLLFEHP